MADVKISQLPAATTPLDGTELTPIVQSGTTKRVSVANLTVGRALTASSLTLSTPLSAANGGTGLTSLGTGIATFLGTPTSANLAAAVTDETGTGALVFGTSPTITFPAGTVGAPSLTTTGDTNTGIYFPAADTIGFATNGTEDARFDSVGNLILNSATLSPTQTAAGSIAMTGTLAMGSSFLRNRIINGDMRIDQRNAGASVSTTNVTVSTYTLDRWAYYATVASKYTVQQNAGSVTPPVGFTSYLGCTSTSAYSITSGDLFLMRQPIEGLNVADLAWGTANARTVTLSFQVYSSLTGTFGGAIGNSAGNRQYPFSYTVSSANTWTPVTITIAGDTTGTWLTTNGIGVVLYFSLGAGSTYTGTAGAWGTTAYSATGATSVVGTNGAAFYITGVQLEVGSVATPFERRQFGTELMLCQRYFTSTTPVGTAAITATGGFWTMIETSELNRVLAPFMFPVPMRASPTMTAFSTNNAATGAWYNRSTGLNATVSSLGANSFGITFNTLTNNQTAGNQMFVAYTASAEL